MLLTWFSPSMSAGPTRTGISKGSTGFGSKRVFSAAIDLAWVAAGRFDGYAEHNLGPWDMAAGTLLVREAGGHVTDIDGGQTMFKSGTIVAGNAHVHRALLEALAEAGKPG